MCQPAPPFNPPVTRAAVSRYSATHHLERRSVRPPNVVLAVRICFQTKGRCLVCVKVSRPSVRVKRRPRWQLRTGTTWCIQLRCLLGHPWATSGYLWEQGTDLQGSGCGLAGMVFSFVHMGCLMLCLMTTGAKPDFKIHFVSLFAEFLCSLWLFFFCMDLHVSRQVQLGQKSPTLAG